MYVSELMINKTESREVWIAPELAYFSSIFPSELSMNRSLSSPVISMQISWISLRITETDEMIIFCTLTSTLGQNYHLHWLKATASFEMNPLFRLSRQGRWQRWDEKTEREKMNIGVVKHRKADRNNTAGTKRTNERKQIWRRCNKSLSL